MIKPTSLSWLQISHNLSSVLWTLEPSGYFEIKTFDYVRSSSCNRVSTARSISCIILGSYKLLFRSSWNSANKNSSRLKIGWQSRCLLVFSVRTDTTSKVWSFCATIWDLESLNESQGFNPRESQTNYHKTRLPEIGIRPSKNTLVTPQLPFKDHRHSMQNETENYQHDRDIMSKSCDR